MQVTDESGSHRVVRSDQISEYLLKVVLQNVLMMSGSVREKQG